MPEVSVVIPAYNAARYLADAIESVLAQSYKDVEILVVDDGSTDDTPSVATHYEGVVRYIRQDNQGVAAARNRGIGESRGRYVAFLDADDVWETAKLEHQVQALADQPGCLACYTAATVVEEGLVPVKVERRGPLAPTQLELFFANRIGTPSSVLVDRDLLNRAGGFDTGLSQCADWEMWIRLRGHASFCYVDEPLIQYRQHTANMSRSASLLEQDSLRALEKGFAIPGLPGEIVRQRKAVFGRNYMVLAGTYFHAGHYGSFLRCAARAVALNPAQMLYLLGFPLRKLVHWRQRSSRLGIAAGGSR
jgi:glycosyltransferase involved in cell wall biosynthesis